MRGAPVAFRVPGPLGSGRDRSWRAAVAAAAAAAGVAGVAGVELSLRLPPRRFVDLDTLVERVLGGLRDGGAVAARGAGLDVVVAARGDAAARHEEGLEVALHPGAEALLALAPPGPTAVRAATPIAPRPGRMADVLAWQAALAAAWRGRPPLTSQVWADLELAVGGSLLPPLEPALDALEPVLGRDPRGRTRFFPNDHLIRWLRVRRRPEAAGGVVLALGPLQLAGGRGAGDG